MVFQLIYIYFFSQIHYKSSTYQRRKNDSAPAVQEWRCSDTPSLPTIASISLKLVNFFSTLKNFLATEILGAKFSKIRDGSDATVGLRTYLAERNCSTARWRILTVVFKFTSPPAALGDDCFHTCAYRKGPKISFLVYQFFAFLWTSSWHQLLACYNIFIFEICIKKF